MKKVLKWLGIAIGILVLTVAGYVAYVFLSYHRIPDHQDLTPETAENPQSETVLTAGKDYTAVTYNIGFGAYLPDYSFFMDGGKYSWGKSKASVTNAVKQAGALVGDIHPDFALIQEIDLDGTRSYHVDQYRLLKQALPEYHSAFGINYDSPFLMYPLQQPHGKNKAGLSTFSRYGILSSERRSLPISTGFSKLFDLDRCYTISRIPVDNGKELVIFNLHLSAYGNSDEIRTAQVGMLTEDMKKEYAAGNYVLCGGDFNHDLKAEEGQEEERASWAYPFPRTSLPQHFSFCMDTLSSQEKERLWNSARNADMPYVEGKTYTVTLDGFIISDNITCIAYENKNTGYAYSDHEPVVVTFRLEN